MIEIGGRPILWHIMKLYAHHGITDFVICLGYKEYMIKEYFMNFVLHHSDVTTIDATKNSVTHHQSNVSHRKLATVTAVRPPGRYGALEIDGSTVKSFVEKPPGDNAYVNNGFFVLNPAVIDRIEGDKTFWESAPLDALAPDAQLAAYRHYSFWQPMDTLRDKMMLEEFWQSGRALWRRWS